mgnify:CR=1 FL=1
MPRATAAKTQTLASRAEMVYDRCGRDSNRAIDELTFYISHNPTTEAARIAATALIGNLMSKDRATIFAGGIVPVIEVPPADNDDVPGSTAPTMAHEDMPSFQTQESKEASGQRLVRATMNGLFGLVFKHESKDITLGLATPAQLRPIASRYIELGATNLRRGRWLERICAAATEGRPVSESLTLKQIEKMKAEADKVPV